LQTREIAGRLGITQGTAKLHLHNMYAKLGIHSRVKLALTWMNHQEDTRSSRMIAPLAARSVFSSPR
jgi:hypothetical protein